MSTCTHYLPTTNDGGHCRINAFGNGVMVGPKICRVCPSYDGPAPAVAAGDDRGVASTVHSRLPGLGTVVEKIAKPFARVLKSDCLDDRGALKLESGCAKRRDALNRVRLPSIGRDALPRVQADQQVGPTAGEVSS